MYAKDPTKHPTTVGAAMTSTTRDENDYCYFAEKLKKAKIDTLTSVTDGEVALENAIEREYPITIPGNNHLHCFEHVDMDMKRLLATIVNEQMSQKIRREILGAEYAGKRIKGLVDSDSCEEFDERLVELEESLPEEFKAWMHTEKGRKRSLIDTLKVCMIKGVRTAAGLGDPPNKSINQRVESMNTVIKEASNHQVVDQVKFHDIMYEKVFLQQASEYAHAVSGYGDNKKRSHTQLDSRKQVIAFQDRVMTINIKEAQHPLK